MNHLDLEDKKELSTQNEINKVQSPSLEYAETVHMVTNYVDYKFKDLCQSTLIDNGLYYCVKITEIYILSYGKNRRLCLKI